MSEPIGALRAELSANAAAFERDMGRARRAVNDNVHGMNRSIKTFHSSVDQNAKSLINFRAVATAAGIAILAIGAAFRAAFVRAREFGRAMAEVSTLLPTSDDMGKLTDAVKDLAKQFGTSTIEQAKALYQVISAGASTAAEAINTLTAANKLAIGGVTTIETAADGLTSVLNAYGTQVESVTAVSDTMFVGMQAGKTTIGELSSSLGQVAPLASSAGVGFDELVASIAALTKQGIRTSVAVAGLRAIIAAIVKPSSEAQKQAEALGIEFNAAALKAKGLAGFMEELRIKTGGNTAALAQLFGGVEALVPAMALLGNGAQDFADILDDMEGKTGATEVAFGKMETAADLAFKQATAAGSEFIDRMVEALRLMEAFTIVARGFSRVMADETPQEEVAKISERVLELKERLAELKAPGLFPVPPGAIAAVEAEIESLVARYNEITDAVKANQIAQQEAEEAARQAAEAQRKLNEEAAAAADAADAKREAEIAAAEATKIATEAAAEAKRLELERTLDLQHALAEEVRLRQSAEQFLDRTLENYLNATDQHIKLIEKRRDEELAALQTIFASEAEIAAARVQINETAQAEIADVHRRAMEERTRLLDRETDKLINVTDELGFQFRSAFEEATTAGAKFSDVLSAIEQDLMRLLSRMASDAFTGLFSTLLGSLFGTGQTPTVFKSAKGNAFNNGQVIPFAKGGIVDRPTLFPMKNGAGLMGEAGPEAVMPLKRIGGRLGVSAEGFGGNVEVHIHNNTAAQIRTEERNTARGKSIKVFIDEITSQNLNSQMSDTSRSLRNSYGIRPTLIPRG